MSERMLERFVSLCETPSPTGSERVVADAVLTELRALGIEVTEDGAAGPARAGAGNLIARIPGRSERWIALCAHLDTVPHDGPIDVVREDGLFRSGGETILGADNKAAVTVLAELAARHAADPPPVGLELLFTVAEEEGLRGAKELDVSALRADVCFVLDHASPIGDVVVASPAHYAVLAEFTGREAHAGIRPEDGHSAIAAAAAAIGAMRLGRLEPGTSANVGTIRGGTAPNVVAGRCRLEGEARSLDEARASEVAQAMVDACTWAASEHACDVDVRLERHFQGYRVPAGARSLALARAALERCGQTVNEIETGGGSDADALRAAGLDCVLLANGTEANHTPEERVAAERIEQMLEVCEALVGEAARE